MFGLSSIPRAFSHTLYQAHVTDHGRMSAGISTSSKVWGSLEGREVRRSVSPVDLMLRIDARMWCPKAIQ